MARHRTLAVAIAAALCASGCGAANQRNSLQPAASNFTEPAAVSAPGQRLAFADQRYRMPIFPSATSTTVTYGSAPDFITNAPVTLQLDLYRPAGDVATNRPLLVWIHGGAFLSGNRGQMAAESRAYARLGYVTASISYRLDPGNHCLQVQAGLYSGDELVAERARCEKAILGARDDAAMAIAWLRANAATFGIDPTRVAVGGSSAGAITAIHVGQTLNMPGSPPPAASQVSAVLAMSGCNYVDNSIDALDAPIAVSASGGDPLVPFACSVATVNAAQAVGTPVVRNFYEQEGAHAQTLYAEHRAEIDRSWRLFLIDHLDLA
ncbi:MAG: alpha/beta hydrolase [Ilumatobacteraceae bacterium]|nr:alpha/beta hydrolase [Ilumatobacteraceae bacterium]